jgi:hypothetical protein
VIHQRQALKKQRGNFAVSAAAAAATKPFLGVMLFLETGFAREPGG